jgi:poly(A) polymerase
MMSAAVRKPAGRDNKYDNFYAMANLERDFLQDYPDTLRRGLAEVASSSGVEIFVAGGVVRDFLLGRASLDLDLTVSSRALACAAEFARLTGGTFVPLDADEDVARVVWQGYSIDFAVLRKGYQDIVSDLKDRDFTINALAVAFDRVGASLKPPYSIIDPLDGMNDIAGKCIRATNDRVFADDPLRLLRAYRFMATLNFMIAPATGRTIRENRRLINSSSAERINYELQKIMAADGPHLVIAGMADSGILFEIFPELQAGVGVEQPSSHHLDVYSHCQETLRHMTRVLEQPETYYPGLGSELEAYLARRSRRTLLHWAALFHDLGKPKTLEVRGEKKTFYNHDKEGGRIFIGMAERLRWGRNDTQLVAKLIEHHMRPFHLTNASRKTGITARACLRLVRAVGDDLPGIFLLAMADSLAGQGPGKPAGTERSLAQLYLEVAAVYRNSIKPVFEEPPLLNGHDLQELFGLEPGPVFRKILTGLQEAQVEKKACTREEALSWVASYLEKNPAEKIH